MTCCPSSARTRPDAPRPRLAPAGKDRSERAQIPGGRCLTGAQERILPQDGEYPAREVRLRPFQIDTCAVTNARFAQFIADTGYLTDATRYGWSFVFHGLLDAPTEDQRLEGLDWWCRVDGACWDHPEGPRSTIADRMDHPVTHVSWNDASAFATWAGGRLPTEAEWECAAQGGQTQARFPWGEAEPDDTAFMPCNIWQGSFPHTNTAADGYVGTAPARSFAPNAFGLYNMVGNTWEWTADRFRIKSLSKAAKQVNAHAAKADARVVKGGSFLCHKSYCYRYRIAARTSNTPETTLSHTGFRLCYD